MTAEEKLAHQRLSVLQLAEMLGNVTEACRQRDISRTQFYEYNDVLPFYRDQNILVEKILTDNGREFCGSDSHPYEVYLQLNDIKHKRTKVRKPQTNGFVERFHRTVLDEFFRLAFRSKLYESHIPHLKNRIDSIFGPENRVK
jgi:transposase InsO family protein